MKSKTLKGSLLAIAVSISILSVAKAQEYTHGDGGEYDPFPAAADGITDQLEKASRPYPEVHEIVKQWTQRMEDENLKSEEIRTKRNLQEAQDKAVELYHQLMRRAGME